MKGENFITINEDEMLRAMDMYISKLIYDEGRTNCKVISIAVTDVSDGKRTFTIGLKEKEKSSK